MPLRQAPALLISLIGIICVSEYRSAAGGIENDFRKICASVALAHHLRDFRCRSTHEPCFYTKKRAFMPTHPCIKSITKARNFPISGSKYARYATSSRPSCSSNAQPGSRSQWRRTSESCLECYVRRTMLMQMEVPLICIIKGEGCAAGSSITRAVTRAYWRCRDTKRRRATGYAASHSRYRSVRRQDARDPAGRAAQPLRPHAGTAAWAAARREAPDAFSSPGSRSSA